MEKLMGILGLLLIVLAFSTIVYDVITRRISSDPKTNRILIISNYLFLIIILYELAEEIVSKML